MSATTAGDAASGGVLKRRRGMTGFYVAAFAALGLAVLGGWLWTAWTNWQFDEPEARRRQAEAARQLGVPVETAVDLPPSPSSAKASEGFGAASGGGVALELVLVPPGMFDMGSPDGETGRNDSEGPVHRVRISRAFYMGKYEVTQEQWEQVMGTNPSSFKGPKLPVECVSWDDCRDFLKKLNAQVPSPAPSVVGAGFKPAPTGPRWAFRLPTEAEWEWACRAGTRRRFCCGDADARLGEYAWHDANSGNTTHPVGEKRPNAWGLHDCHGNVWEWCSDWFGEYGANPWQGKFRWVPDPTGPTSGNWRVMRGGSWLFEPPFCRSASRGGYSPVDRLRVVGFRVVASAGAGVD